MPDPVLIPAAGTRVAVIVGPTAVGKTEMAEQVAVRLAGEIVSADSMQVYRGLDIGTAKPPVAHRRAPYHCIDIVDAGEPFSAALYQTVARAAVAEIAERGRLPILTGGTGLYIRAVLDDWRFPHGEQVGNVLRERYERIAEAEGADALHSLLARRDPESAALVHPRNVRRVVRALEVLDVGGSYAEQHAGFSARTSVYDARIVGLTMERAALYGRIDERVEEMIASGLLGEIETLLSAGLRDALTASQAIGYKEFVPVIDGAIRLEDAVAQVKQASRRYAKRQLSWFRGDPRVLWVDMTDRQPAEAVSEVLTALDWSEARVREHEEQA